MILRILYSLAVITLVILGGWFVFGGSGSPQADEARVRAQVERFGRAQKEVSLLSPTAIVEIENAYGQYVESNLLAQWKQDPERAPGRLTSSPWPERIDILQVERAASGHYLVQGELVFMTSTGPAGSIPVTLALEEVGEDWLIFAYDTRPQTTIAPQTRVLALGERVTVLGVSITPQEVIEDSRCPTDATCIQAGTVRVSTEIVSGLGTSEMVLELGKPITTEAEEITLIAVEPTPLSGTSVLSEDYRFTFHIEGRDTSY